jgi:hypothetical protein
MKHLTILFMTILAFCDRQAFSQKTIEVDSVFGVINQQLPFDEEFVIKIPTKSPRVCGVSYLEHIGRRDFGGTIRYQEKFNYLHAYPIHPINPNDVQVSSISGKNYILIKFRNPSLLKPGKKYTLFWAEEVSIEILDLFNLYDSHARSDNAKALAAAQSKYSSFSKKTISTFNYPLNIDSAPEDTVKLTRVAEIYQYGKFHNLYEASDKAEAAFLKEVKASNQIYRLWANDRLGTLAQEIVKRSPKFDHDLRQKFLPSEMKATNRLFSLLRSADSTRRDILKGLRTLDMVHENALDTVRYEERAANLKLTRTSVDELVTITQVLATPAETDLTMVLNELLELQSQLRKLETAFAKVIKVRKAIKDYIFRQAFSNLTTFGGTTFVYSFEVRSKLSISPDFGVVTTRLGNDDANDYPFVPYLGFQVNLRPINRDIDFKSYRHNFWHRPSIMLGWSLVSIDSDSLRGAGKDSVSSFFSKGKGTLLTGLGFRLNGAIRVTAGYMWYFNFSRSAANPAIYDRRRLRAWPYLGMSLDLNLKDLLSGITDIFTGLPRRYQAPKPTVSDVQP